MARTFLVLLGGIAILTNSGIARAWSPKTAPLMTRWAAQVDPRCPLPEYPRPQMVRKDWLNLNGVWEYQPGGENDVAPVGKKLASEILVPFPVESALSGVMEHHDRLWYRRTFTVPPEWKGRQVLLHFGAVDYECEVFINGKQLGMHRGGYDPFTFDATGLFSAQGGQQEIIVRVYDPTNAAGEPRGKQSVTPGGIMYTPTTGIWQTVWLEPVAHGGIDDLKIVPDVNAGTVRLTVTSLGDPSNESINVTVRKGTTVVQTAAGEAGKEITVPMPGAMLWSPDAPNLYDLEISVMAEGSQIDQINSYFGMRKVELADAGGVKKIFLNGKFVFQNGALDQGFWPDGIYTAPTDEALKYDIDMLKKCGFNMVRKHIKVEPARWYYWCDQMGLLVWQDMPSANSYADIVWFDSSAAVSWKKIKRDVPPLDTGGFERELRRMVQTHWNSPSIIMWDLFNEAQGQHDTAKLAAAIKSLDPTRLVNAASGGQHLNVGDVYDDHHYPPPSSPRANKSEAIVCGEYGGVGLRIPGHMWIDKKLGYNDAGSPADLENVYADFADELKEFRDKQQLSAAVYTQLTDVEVEINGLFTYDRNPKVDLNKIARCNHFQMPPATYVPVVPTSEASAQEWKYTTARPAANWMSQDFNASDWSAGKGGFGSKNSPAAAVPVTLWNTPDIWLRRTFRIGSLTAGQIANLMVRDIHSDDVEVYVNGVLAYRSRGGLNRYEDRPVSFDARKALIVNSDNVLAVTCRHTAGEQHIDVGLSLRQRAEN